jgi:hypothetical protein
MLPYIADHEVEGRRLGGSVFASYDRRACDLVTTAGGAAHCLAAAPN